jgi:Amt family ammonium transporter
MTIRSTRSAFMDGNPSQVLNQAAGCGVAIVIAVVGTYLILKVCDAITGIRATEAQEIEGLDLSMHGEEGYNFEA